jgi:hypothetical protein
MESAQAIAKTWRTFLIELEFARNYPIVYQLNHGPAVRNPVLERILPSLLHIKMAALLDEALETYLISTGTTGYQESLYGRISFCSETGRIPHGTALHDIRKRRNDAAHQPATSVSWMQLDQDLTVVHAALQHLGLVCGRPHFDIEAERSEARDSQEPGINCHFDYAVILLENGRKEAAFTWRETLHKDATS